MSELRTKDGVPVAADFAFHEPPLVENFGSGVLYTINEIGTVQSIGGYDITAAEIAAGVTPVYYNYSAYDLPRYGSVIDGATNDGAAIRNWLLASIQAGAVAYSSVKGTALCSSFTAVDTTGNVRIYAPGLTIKGPASATDFCRPGGSVVYCEGVTFDRWGSAFERESAESGSLIDFRVFDCEFTSFTSIPINIERPITDYRIVRNTFDACSGGFAVRIGTNTYANQDTWLKGEVSNNLIKTLTASGSMAAACGMLIYGREVSICENIIDSVQDSSAAGEAYGIYTKARYGIISGNVLRNVNSTGTTSIVGINIKGATRGVTSSPQGFSVVCSNNQVFNVGTTNVKGIGIRIQTDDVSVCNNIVEDGGIHGITSDEDAGSNNGQIDNNKIRFSSATGSIGVYLATGGAKHRITNNLVTGTSIGIRLASATSVALSEVTVEGNEGDATTALIDINTPAGIDRLTIRNNRLTSGARGVLNDGGAGAITNLVIEDNDFDRATTALIGGTIPAGSVIRQRATITTTDATLTTLLPLALADESAQMLSYKVVGMQSDGANRAMYRADTLIYRDGGGATIQGTEQIIGTPQESNAAWACAVSVSSNSALVRVTGVAATTIRWKGDIELLGVA